MDQVLCAVVCTTQGGQVAFKGGQVSAIKQTVQIILVAALASVCQIDLYVIETNAGLADDFNLRIGDTVGI